VDAATVFTVLQRNVDVSREVVRQLVTGLASLEACACGTSLDAALVTPAHAVRREARERLGPILARRLQAVPA
jgi:hypothetical protein